MADAASTRSGGRKGVFWILFLGLAYAVAYCLFYGLTSMGAYPVLDGKENLQLAWDIADSSLPQEPFYRAPLYPLILSIAMGLGLPDSLWPDFARLINLVAWLVSVWLVSRLAGQVWNNERAGLLAAAVWALYPVGLFFLGDPLDILLSIALLLGGLDRAAAFLRSASAQQALACGFLLVLAALTRPQMWSVALAMPVILLVLVYGVRRRQDVDVIQPNEQMVKTPPRWPVFLIFLGMALPALMMGAFNKKLSGDFVIMPTQGPFNLWAANKPGAHGKYYVQQIEVHQQGEHRNPARLEARYHFEQEFGEDVEGDWHNVNHYWRQRTVGMIAEDPLGLVGRLARKGYYLLNHHEQYNNKTYAVHKGLSPVLAWNPLGWGVLLTLAAPLLFWGRRNPLLFTTLLLASLAYAASLLLTYVSARFRLPLAPLLAVLLGGWATLPWVDARGWRLWAGVAMIPLAAGLAFTNFFGVREPPTAIQDYLLLGYAALDAGDDSEALRWANRALEEDPTRLAARELAVVTRYNQWLTKVLANGGPTWSSDREDDIAEAQSLADYSPRVRYITGVYEWSMGEAESARARWLGLLDGQNADLQNALTALIMTGQPTTPVLTALARLPEDQRLPQLQVALAYSKGQPLNSAGEAILKQLMAVYFTGPEA